MKKLIKVLLVAVLFIAVPKESDAQSSVMEVSWNVYNSNFTGLMVMFPDNTGIFKLRTFVPGTGWVWVLQDAVLTNQFDAWGNCTVYINCFNPRTVPYVPYNADNFVIFPNGAMYTQDSAGTWSTQIVASMVPAVYWPSKFQEYGLN